MVDLDSWEEESGKSGSGVGNWFDGSGVLLEAASWRRGVLTPESGLGKGHVDMRTLDNSYSTYVGT